MGKVITFEFYSQAPTFYLGTNTCGFLVGRSKNPGTQLISNHGQFANLYAPVNDIVVATLSSIGPYE